jgi:hypothetical protein
VGLEEALQEVRGQLVSFGAAADKASEQAGEHKAAEEATLLGERARVAAEMVGLLGAESSEQILKIEGLNHAFGARLKQWASTMPRTYVARQVNREGGSTPQEDKAEQHKSDQHEDQRCMEQREHAQHHSAGNEAATERSLPLKWYTVGRRDTCGRLVLGRHAAAPPSP